MRSDQLTWELSVCGAGCCVDKDSITDEQQRETWGSASHIWQAAWCFQGSSLTLQCLKDMQFLPWAHREHGGSCLSVYYRP